MKESEDKPISYPSPTDLLLSSPKERSLFSTPAGDLLASLREEEDSLHEVLRSSGPKAALQKGRDLCTSLLIDATPKAIRTLAYLSESAAPKERIAAASKLLDKSPLIQDNTASSGGRSSISDEALKTLFSSMGSFLNLALSSKEETINVTPEGSSPFSSKPLLKEPS